MRIPWAAAALLIVLAGCADGADDEPEADPDAGATTEEVPTPTETPAEPPVNCVTDAVATFPGAGEVALQDGKAVPLGGPAYTIFAGDYDVPADGLATAGAQAGPGQHLAFVATTIFNGSGDSAPLEIGTPIEWTGEFKVLTFAVMLDEEGEQHGNNVGAGGTLTVTGLDDESICVDVDYRDEEKSVVGTIAATIV